MFEIKMYRFNGAFNQFVRSVIATSEYEKEIIVRQNEALGMDCYVTAVS